MAIAGACSNFPVVPSFHAVAHEGASSVEEEALLLLPTKAHEGHRAGMHGPCSSWAILL